MKKCQNDKSIYANMWHLTEEYDLRLSNKDLIKIINKKLAKIIIELEHNPISFKNGEKNND